MSPAATLAPIPLPGDPAVDAALAGQHKLSSEEYARIVSALKRTPTYTELGVFSVMWSEHCSYKSSRVHLRRLPTKGPRVLQGPGENAGVVDIGDGYAAVFKMESHNHPSFIEPHQGAATGVGGILRDVFTMGARPIAGLNSLRFGRPDHPRTPELLQGVVDGIGGYGNCIGVPTVGGELQFDGRYDGNILVNAFACGIARTDRIFYGRASGTGNKILYIGAKTGRDGIHGATMASDEFSEGGPSQRPTMQVGDPFMGKLLLEACLELFAEDVLEGIQDMGAAGLTSSSVEMAGRAGSGIEIDLDAVPRRARHMTPYEILLSESQERMLLVAKPGKEKTVTQICAKWELDCAVIGRVTTSGRWVVTATPEHDPLDDLPSTTCPVTVCDLPIDALTDGAPAYERPEADPPTMGPRSAPPVPGDLREEILELCACPNIGSRRWVYRQFDHVVRGGTVVRPGSDAAVVRVLCERDAKGTLASDGGHATEKLLAFSVDCNGRHVELDPFQGAAMAVAEACRNLVCSGAEPIGMTDCLNFGNPERKDVMRSLTRAIDGIAAACTALAVPIVSGNVSLYNETDGRAILPTPTVAAVGLVRSESDVVTQWWKRAGDVVLLLGGAVAIHGGAPGLAGSEYAAWKESRGGGPPTGAVPGAGCAPPEIDLSLEAKLQKVVLGLARAHHLESAHDVSKGGLAVALAECATSSPSYVEDVGARIDLLAPSGSVIATPELASLLFGEHPSRIVVSVRPESVSSVQQASEAAGVPCAQLGVTGGSSLSIALTAAHPSGGPIRSAPGAWGGGNPRMDGGTLVANVILRVSELRLARERCLVSIVGE
jgi:phosphoribosylformylglycinamidine synthase subunit PurL